MRPGERERGEAGREGERATGREGERATGREGERATGGRVGDRRERVRPEGER